MWGVSHQRLASLTTHLPRACLHGDSCQGTGCRMARDGWPLRPRLPRSAETRAGGHGLAAPTCNQLYFLPQLNDHLHWLTLTYSITFLALKDSQ